MPAHYLQHLSLQEQVDYVDTCQKRVAADTLALEKAATFTLTANEAAHDLPDETVEIRAVFDGSLPLEELTTSELLEALSGVGAAGFVNTLSYAVVGRKLYVLPLAAADRDITLVYSYRAPAFSSQDDLTLEGDERELVEQLLDAYVTFDRGETEVGVASLLRYIADARRQRTVNRLRTGSPDRRPVISHDRFL